MATIVQIFGLEHPEDACAAAAYGVDHLGFSIGDPILPKYISLEEGQHVFAMLPSGVTTVALFATPDAELVRSVAHALQPTMVQLCWEVDALGPEAEAALRADLRPIRVIKEIPVGGPERRERSLTAAGRYAPCADYLILDTAPPALPWIGATGLPHDWTISRAIVESSPVPCILAGGLGPDNVAAALTLVRPWGVDSFSRTNRADGRKDLAKVRAFYDTVKAFDAGQGVA
jgi:phosphoribosylanthranilate isomerase